MGKMIRFWRQFEKNKTVLVIVTAIYKTAICILGGLCLYVLIMPLVGGWMLGSDASKKIEQCITGGVSEDECLNRYDW